MLYILFCPCTYVLFSESLIENWYNPNKFLFIINFIRRWGNNMVSQRLKKHTKDIVYLQKMKPCIRKHLITKADRSFVDCLCEYADNILS